MATKAPTPAAAVADTTVADATKPTEQPDFLKPTPEMNPRNAVLESIGERSADPVLRAEIIGEDPDAPPLAEGEEPMPGPLETEAPATETPTEGDAPPAEAAVPEGFLKLMVDGKEVLVEQAKVLERGVAAMQKETAVDSRLAAVDALVNELAAQRQQRPSQQQEPQQPAPKPLQERIAEMHQAIAYGTPEQGQAAMFEFLQLAASPVQQVKTEVLREVDQKTATQEFIKDYSDLLQDPMAMELVFAMERRVRANERAQGLPPKPFGELYKEIGSEVRSYRTKLRDGAVAAAGDGQPTPTPTPTGGAQPAPTNRTAAKLNAPRAVSGGSPAPAKPASSKVPTLSEQINEIASARGQRQFGGAPRL